MEPMSDEDAVRQPPLDEMVGDELFYTQAQLADRWQVSRRTIDNEVERGALPVTYIRRSRRFAREHVVAYELRNTTSGPRHISRGAAASDT